MTATTLRDRLRGVFTTILEDDSLPFDESLAMGDVESWDSFNQINLMLAIEDEFGVEFGADEIGQLLSVGAIMAALEARAVASGS